MPALLLENFLLMVDIGIKHCIEIHMHQILKILVIAACNRINRLVAVCHGVQKCVERPLHKLYKRVLNRKILRAAQHRMLHNMRHPRGVRRRRAETNIKYLVLVIIAQQCNPCTCPFVL